METSSRISLHTRSGARSRARTRLRTTRGCRTAQRTRTSRDQPFIDAGVRNRGVVGGYEPCQPFTGRSEGDRGCTTVSLESVSNIYRPVVNIKLPDRIGQEGCWSSTHTTSAGKRSPQSESLPFGGRTPRVVRVETGGVSGRERCGFVRPCPTRVSESCPSLGTRHDLRYLGDPGGPAELPSGSLKNLEPPGM